MALSFTRFKDRIWFLFDGILRRIRTAPDWVERATYGAFGGLLSVAYHLPGAPLKPTNVALAKILGRTKPSDLHRDWIAQMKLGLARMEMLRNGETDALDAMLEIPDVATLEAALAEGHGAVLVMPHCQASISMVRGLAARYPTLMLVRESKQDARAATQHSYYVHLGCECIDVRRTPEAKVARAVLKALKSGMLVVGVVDRIKATPPKDTTYDKTRDMVRVTSFGQPIGMVGWPARFAGKLKSPILPAMVVQTDTAITLELGAPLTPGSLEETTQGVASALESFVRKAPQDWLFIYDKQWARVLRAAAAQLP
ncbi:hypothetical protein [Dinoroseobacter sp. S76]|uniref:LpxL/LpxP family acyltransferase n=1 Tax=Dinoroseobacter sp. S76 TaxID=3415124 RepID=UPI003C7AB809